MYNVFHCGPSSNFHFIAAKFIKSHCLVHQPEAHSSEMLFQLITKWASLKVIIHLVATKSGNSEASGKIANLFSIRENHGKKIF